MADNNNLGMSMSMDTTNLKAGLDRANRLIRESESEFKAAAAGMDDWTQSQDGLEKRIKHLNTAQEQQKTKIASLKSEYQRLIDDGLDPTSEQAIKLRTNINKEQEALNKTEKELKKQTEALEDLTRETDDATEELEDNSKALKDVEKNSEKAGKGYEKFGNMAKAAGKVASAAVAAAGAAIIGITKQAIESYAEYEQLVGGVETLFKGNADAVKKYAENAYKTAGMTANDYMSTVTSFSASLIQSLGGDTEKAAEYANVAITDMSDNANKMGSDIESLQNAYGGFAKQNFTMLDNLKLGYGGTKTEMERLLADAEKISGVKYDISSYADITQAIHVMQEEMGIAGTTAKEASETIQGSLAAMKGAWSNLLTGLADENADIDSLVNNLIDSITTAAKNLMPRIKTVLTGIITLIRELLPEIPPLLKDLMPEFIAALTGMIKGFVEVLPTIIQSIVDFLPAILKAIIEMLPEIVDAIIEITVAIIEAMTEMLPEIVDAIIQIVPKLINALLNAIPQLLDASITFLMAIIDAIPVIIPALIKELPKIIEKTIDVLLNNMPVLTAAAVELFLAIIDAIPVIIRTIGGEIPKIIRGIVDGLIEGIPLIIKCGGDILAGLFKGILNFKEIYKSVAALGKGIVDGVKEFFGINSPSKLMADQVGKNLALGIGKGFENNIEGVNAEITDAMNFETSGTNRNGKAAVGGVVVYQTNNYSQAHSRYELYKSKNATTEAVRLAVGSV